MLGFQMPNYEFENQKGEIVVLTMSIPEYSRRCKNGTIRHRGQKLNRYMGKSTVQFVDTPGNWPRKSMVMGISNPTPEHIKKEVSRAAAAGIDIGFDSKTGECIVKDPSTNRAYAEFLGMHSLNSYGGHGEARFNGKAPDVFKDNEIPIPDPEAYERLKKQLDSSPAGRGFGSDTHPSFRREGNKLIVDPKYMARIRRDAAEAKLNPRARRQSVNERIYNVRTS